MASKEIHANLILVNARITGAPTPLSSDELTNKAYVDSLVGGGSALGLDGGSPSSNYVAGPALDCGGVT